MRSKVNIHVLAAATACTVLLAALFAASADSWASENDSQTVSHPSLREQFRSQFAAWREHVRQAWGQLSLTDARMTNHPLFVSMVELGPPALPFVIEAMKETGRDPIERMWLRILARHILKKGYIRGANMNALLIQWWDGGRARTPQEFQVAYERWKSSEDQIERQEAYQALLHLGIAALPCAVEEIRRGDIELVHAVSYWTEGVVMRQISKRRVRVSDWGRVCWQWWEANKEKWLLPPLPSQAEE